MSQNKNSMANKLKSSYCVPEAVLVSGDNFLGPVLYAHMNIFTLCKINLNCNLGLRSDILVPGLNTFKFLRNFV